MFKGRSSKGIKGIQLNDKDKVISVSILDNSKIDQKTINKDKKPNTTPAIWGIDPK